MIGSAIGGGAGAAASANKRDRNGAIIGGALGGAGGYTVGKNMGGTNGGYIGAALGSALGLGSNVGRLGGHLISRLFNKNKSHHLEGKRLDDLSIQSSTYGQSIPIVYGQAIIGCNIICRKITIDFFNGWQKNHTSRFI